VAETLVGTRLHFLVGELSSCAEAVDLSSTELSADALSCLEAPLRGLSALAANRSDARAPAPIEDGPRPAGPPDGDAAPPIWPNTSARRLLQQNLCGSGEVRYETACGTGSCNSGDREIGVTCDGCGVTCATWPIKAGTKEICCRKPTPSPTRAPDNSPTSAPISAPPSAPPASKISNCGLPPPQKTFPTMKGLIDALQSRTVAGDFTQLSLKVTLGSDETLHALVNVSTDVSVEIDGAGRTITLSDFGFHLHNGMLCLHDVELTGGRNVPALVVLGQAAEVNASHVRISNCATHTDLDEVVAGLVSGIDLCRAGKTAFDTLPSLLLPAVCSLLPVPLRQCCDVSKKPAHRADLRLVGNMGAGAAHRRSAGFVALARALERSVGARAAANVRGVCRCSTEWREAVYGGESHLRKFGDNEGRRAGPPASETIRYRCLCPLRRCVVVWSSGSCYL
jgi:hypothetical protein